MTKYKELPTQEYLQECFDYDELTGELTWKERPLNHFKSHGIAKSMTSIYNGKIAGSISSSGYINITINNINYAAHRVIWKHYTGKDPIHVIDHINNIKDDNRIENLRDVPISVNNGNSSMQCSNTSGTIGVGFIKNKWRSRYVVNGNEIYLGSFKNKDDAIKARKEAELKDWSHLETKVREKDKVELTLDYLNDYCYYKDDGWLYRKIDDIRLGYVNNKYINMKIKGYTFKAHRLIYWLCTGIRPPDDMIIDHIDGNPSNNKIDNLRLVTYSQNAINVKLQKSNTSGYKGVKFNKNYNTWVSTISINNKNISLGSFKTKEEAITARKNAEPLYHGEFARK